MQTPMKNAAEIAAQQAADDGRAAEATISLNDRLTYLAQQERALAIQKAILEAAAEAGGYTGQLDKFLFLFERGENVSEEEFEAACEAAHNLVKLGRLRSYLRPILEREAKGIAAAAAHGISDFEAMKRATEMLNRIEEEA